MLIFTAQNAVIVALLQLGVIVFGILAAGASQKIAESLGLPVPISTVLLMDYGLALLPAPLAWIFAALRLKNQSAIPEARKKAAFASGILLLVILFLLVVASVAGPWLGADWFVSPGGAGGQE